MTTNQTTANLKSNTPSRSENIRFAILLTVVVLASFGLRILFLKNLRWTYDEAIHVLFAQMLDRGYAPYSEVFVSYPPLYVLSMDWTWQLFGTVESLQILMAIYTMAGLVGVALIAFRLGGIWAGLFAPIFISLEPEFFRGSRAVLTEIPSISMATLAIAFAAFYLWGNKTKQGRGWLVASGLTLAISLMLKILLPFVVALIPLMILVHQYQIAKNTDNPASRTFLSLSLSFWQKTVVYGLIWGAALIFPIIVFTLIFDIPALIDQAILFRFASRGAYEGEINNFAFMLTIFRDNWPIALLAIIGLWPLIRFQFSKGWFVLAWLLFAAIFALIQVPLRDKHLPMLLPPLTILAGLGVSWLVQLTKRMWKQKPVVGIASVLLLTLVLSVYFWQTMQVFIAYSNYQTQYLSDDKQILVDFIQQFTSPNDCLITDDPSLAFVTNRPVPPNLAEASSARLRSGYLTETMLEEIATNNDCQIVAPVARRFKRSVPDFVEWAKANYLNLWLYDNETEVLIAKPVAHSQPQQIVNARFGDQVELVGYDLWPVSDGAGYLSLYWRPLQPFTQDYTIFVHVRDEQNNTIINADHQPYNGLIPTQRWPVNETIKDTIRLPVSPEVPTGSYNIYAGMYLPDGFVRLPVTQDASGENAVIISNFVVP